MKKKQSMAGDPSASLSMESKGWHQLTLSTWVKPGQESTMWLVATRDGRFVKVKILFLRFIFRLLNAANMYQRPIGG